MSLGKQSRMTFRRFRFFELPTEADTGTGSTEKPCFLSDHIQAPLYRKKNSLGTQSRVGWPESSRPTRIG